MPTQEKKPRLDYDSPWKNVIKRFLRDFMEFCFPLAITDIDWSRGYEYLDKELLTIHPRQNMGKHHADCLFKLWLKNSDELWLLLHLEIQVFKDKHFEERMFVYNYRGFDRYSKSVLSIAILADTNPHWHPRVYKRSSWYNRLEFEFATIKLLDYVNYLPILLQQKNPFAIVIWTHQAWRNTRKKPQERLQSKLAITCALYKSGFAKKDIIDLFCFLDWMLALPKSLELHYAQYLNQLEEEKRMSYITSIERIGISKGMAKGMTKGITKGRAEGKKEGGCQMLSNQLRCRFGKIPPYFQEKLDSASQQQLLCWGEALLNAKVLEDIFID